MQNQRATCRHLRPAGGAAGGSPVPTGWGCRYLWLLLFLLAGEQPLVNRIVLGDAKDLVEGRLALDRLDDSVLEQSAHPLLASQSTYRLGRFSLERHLANLGGQGHQLEDTHAAAIALLVTVVAPLALHEVGLLGQF